MPCQCPLPAAEQSLQRTVADYLALCVPAPPSGPWWTAVNPIPAKSRSAAGISKGMGLRAGTPDIVLCWKGRLVGIELKAGRGRMSPAQLEAHDAITLAGGAGLCVHGRVFLRFVSAGRSPGMRRSGAI